MVLPISRIGSADAGFNLCGNLNLSSSSEIYLNTKLLKSKSNNPMQDTTARTKYKSRSEQNKNLASMNDMKYE